MLNGRDVFILSEEDARIIVAGVHAALPVQTKARKELLKNDKFIRLFSLAGDLRQELDRREERG